jgi:hypothetical protein
MSAKAEPTRQAKSAQRFGNVIRAEFPLLIGLGTAAFFFGAGTQRIEGITHPLLLTAVLLWLFAVILWSAICVVPTVSPSSLASLTEH